MKTHCPKGHDYAEHGYINNWDGSRNCRLCQRVAVMTPRHFITCEVCGHTVKKPKKTTRFCSLSCAAVAGNQLREKVKHAPIRSSPQT